MEQFKPPAAAAVKYFKEITEIILHSGVVAKAASVLVSILRSFVFIFMNF